MAMDADARRLDNVSDSEETALLENGHGPGLYGNGAKHMG